jgi:hypothetical protein
MWNDPILGFSNHQFPLFFCRDHHPAKVDGKTTDSIPLLRA